MRTLFFILVSTAFAAWLFLYGLPEDVTNKAKTAISDLKSIPEKVMGVAEDFLSTPAEKREKVISQLEKTLDRVKKVATLSDVAKEAETLITELRAENNDKPNVISTALSKIVESVLPAKLLGSDPVNCATNK